MKKINLIETLKNNIEEIYNFGESFTRNEMELAISFCEIAHNMPTFDYDRYDKIAAYILKNLKNKNDELDLINNYMIPSQIIFYYQTYPFDLPEKNILVDQSYDLKLERLIEIKLMQIDSDFSTQRKKYITPGQDMIYKAKYDESIEYIKNKKLSSFGFLRLSENPLDDAKNIIEKYKFCLEKISSLEAIRISWKDTFRKCKTIEDFYERNNEYDTKMIIDYKNEKQEILKTNIINYNTSYQENIKPEVINLNGIISSYKINDDKELPH